MIKIRLTLLRERRQQCQGNVQLDERIIVNLLLWTCCWCEYGFSNLVTTHQHQRHTNTKSTC